MANKKLTGRNSSVAEWVVRTFPFAVEAGESLDLITSGDSVTLTTKVCQSTLGVRKRIVSLLKLASRMKTVSPTCV